MLNYSAHVVVFDSILCRKTFSRLGNKNDFKERTISPTPNLFHFFYTSRVSFKFGVITMTAGIIGVPLGSYLSTRLGKTYPRSDPVICAIGLLISAPLIAGSMLVVTANSTLAYILVFLGEVALNCNWAIVADMLLVRLIHCHPFSRLSSSSLFCFMF